MLVSVVMWTNADYMLLFSLSLLL